MEFLMKHWNIGGLEGLNSQAQKAQEDVQALLTKFRRLTDRQVSCHRLAPHVCALRGSCGFWLSSMWGLILTGWNRTRTLLLRFSCSHGAHAPLRVVSARRA